MNQVHPHPSADELLALAERASDLAPEVLAHVDACAACRALLAELARSSFLHRSQVGDAADAIDEAGPAPLRVGSCVGRFRIVDFLGEGGMGTVYRAHDPELDRELALKHPRLRASDVARTSLALEAKAMARVKHGNVAVVYDTVTADGEVFIGMELLPGGTLRLRMNEPHSWRDLLASFIAAGRGLAAAHEAGVVHGDFKPENVLFAFDGTPKVVDFGLASIVRGALVGAGTPEYMAPELAHAPATAASDQFAFAKSLLEALPHAPEKLAALVRRGAAPAPEARYPSMTAFIDALEHYLRPRRSFTLPAVAVATVGALAASALFVSIRARAHAEAPCASAEAISAPLWSGADGARIADAFRATGLAFPEAAPRASTALAAYARAWGHEAENACRATRVEHTQSSELFDLRMDCLEQRRLAFDATRGVLDAADAEVVRRSGQMTAELPRLELCADVPYLRTRVAPLSEPAARAGYDALRKELAEATALEAAGNLQAAEAKLAAAPPKAAALGHKPLEAEVLLELGGLRRQVGNTEDAGTLLDAAAIAADVGHDDRTRAFALLERAFLFAIDAKTTDAERTLALASAAIARGCDDAEMRAREQMVRGALAFQSGQPKPALEFTERGLAFFEKDGHHGMRMASALQNQGISYMNLGRSEEALLAYDRGIAAARAVAGDQHPIIATLLGHRGRALIALRRFDDAESTLRRALALLETSYGADHTRTAVVCAYLATLNETRRTPEQAIPWAERAIATYRARDDQSSLLPEALQAYGDALRALGRVREARAADEEAFSIQQKRFPKHDGMKEALMLSLGRDDMARGDFAAAVARFNAGLAIGSDADDDVDEDRVDMKAELSRALLAAHGDKRRAIVLAEDAYRMYAHHKLDLEQRELAADFRAKGLLLGAAREGAVIRASLKR